ncbi:MAG: alpha/beta hydrolase [Gemmatimonadota bacterium]
MRAGAPRWVASGALAGVLVALATGTASARPPQVRESFIEVGDHFVRALCTAGAPRVMLVHGEGSGADAYRPILERLDGHLGACAYDRRASGDEGAGPRGWFELSDEMIQIHGALGFRPGYTLVGQGVGGLYARLFAAGRPGEVGALLLLEPAHEDLAEALRPGMPRAEWDVLMAGLRAPNEDGIREADLAARARSSRLPRIPVTVVTAMRRRSGDGWDERYLNQGARRVHASILQGVAAGRHVPAQGIGRDVHLEAPDLVVAEILRLSRIARVSSP